MNTERLTGLEKVLKAVADAAGWDWCDEHRQSRCNRHPLPEGWQDYNPMLRDESCEDGTANGTLSVIRPKRKAKGCRWRLF